MKCVLCEVVAETGDRSIPVRAIDLLVVIGRSSGDVSWFASICEMHSPGVHSRLSERGLALTPAGIVARVSPVSAEKRCDNCKSDERPVRLTIDVPEPTSEAPSATRRLRLCAPCCRVAAMPSKPSPPLLARVWETLHSRGRK